MWCNKFKIGKERLQEERLYYVWRGTDTCCKTQHEVKEITAVARKKTTQYQTANCKLLFHGQNQHQEEEEETQGQWRGKEGSNQNKKEKKERTTASHYCRFRAHPINSTNTNKAETTTRCNNKWSTRSTCAPLISRTVLYLATRSTIHFVPACISIS